MLSRMGDDAAAGRLDDVRAVVGDVSDERECETAREMPGDATSHRSQMRLVESGRASNEEWLEDVLEERGEVPVLETSQDDVWAG